MVGPPTSSLGLNDEEINTYLNYDVIEAERGRLTKVVFGDTTASSAFKQFSFGALFGCAAGCLAKAVSKQAALTVGGTLLVLQIAQYNGFITLNWTKIRRSMTRAEAEVRRVALKNEHSILTTIRNFSEENWFLAVGFAAGFAASILFT